MLFYLFYIIDNKSITIPKPNIEKIELIYRGGSKDEIFIPYYKILVKLDTESSDLNLNTYGAYYVPAIEARYIENMPIYDGSFNY